MDVKQYTIKKLSKQLTYFLRNSKGIALNNKSVFKSNKSNAFVDDAVHIFYSPWYKNVKSDGAYSHWNHELLPHWTDHSRRRRRLHQPPGDIGANFYPELGPYSSTDPKVIQLHMDMISKAGVGESFHEYKIKLYLHVLCEEKRTIVLK